MRLVYTLLSNRLCLLIIFSLMIGTPLASQDYFMASVKIDTLPYESDSEIMMAGLMGGILFIGPTHITLPLQLCHHTSYRAQYTQTAPVFYFLYPKEQKYHRSISITGYHTFTIESLLDSVATASERDLVYAPDPPQKQEVIVFYAPEFSIETALLSPMYILLLPERVTQDRLPILVFPSDEIKPSQAKLLAHLGQPRLLDHEYDSLLTRLRQDDLEEVINDVWVQEIR